MWPQAANLATEHTLRDLAKEPNTYPVIFPPSLPPLRGIDFREAAAQSFCAGMHAGGRGGGSEPGTGNIYIYISMYIYIDIYLYIYIYDLFISISTLSLSLSLSL